MERTDERYLDGGIMGARVRTPDWSTTPLGLVETWPQSLRTALSIMLSAAFRPARTHKLLQRRRPPIQMPALGRRNSGLEMFRNISKSGSKPAKMILEIGTREAHSARCEGAHLRILEAEPRRLVRVCNLYCAARDKPAIGRVPVQQRKRLEFRSSPQLRRYPW